MTQILLTTLHEKVLQIEERINNQIFLIFQQFQKRISVEF